MAQDTASVEARLRAALGDRLLAQEPISRHTSFRIGGPADFFFETESPDELRGALRAAHESGVPVFLLGGGTNLLVSDSGFRGLVVRNACRKIELDGTTARVECGADVMDVILRCRDEGLSGLEFAAGLPGSIGGALHGNAGCYGEEIGSLVIECAVAPLYGGEVETRPAAWFEFGYRRSRLKRDPLALLSCLLRLRRGARDEIQRVIDMRLEDRRRKHPQWQVEPTAGSYFRNPPAGWAPQGAGPSLETGPFTAGRLLDLCGCRGLRVGDALVFPRHANIIVNAGHATARDVLALAAEMKRRVSETFGLDLKEEVLFLGDRGSDQDKLPAGS